MHYHLKKKNPPETGLVLDELIFSCQYIVCVCVCLCVSVYIHMCVYLFQVFVNCPNLFLAVPESLVCSLLSLSLTLFV